MTFDHRTTQLHVADLEREIETLRTERAMASGSDRPGPMDRARHAAGRLLISAGETLAGRDETLRAHRA